MSDDSDTIVIIHVPPNQNLVAGSGTALECHLLAMLDKLMTGRDNGYSIEVQERDG